jgi:hypothetical protein
MAWRRRAPYAVWIVSREEDIALRWRAHLHDARAVHCSTGQAASASVCYGLLHLPLYTCIVVIGLGKRTALGVRLVRVGPGPCACALQLDRTQSGSEKLPSSECQILLGR